MQQSLVARELITRKQTTEQPNRHFEVLNVEVFVEREILNNVLASVVRFILKSHQDHRVERIDGSHQQRLRVPIMIGLAERLEIVMAPRVLFVAVPGVKKFRTNLHGKLFLVHTCLQVRLQQRGYDQQKYYSSVHFRNLLLPESDRYSTRTQI